MTPYDAILRTHGFNVITRTLTQRFLADPADYPVGFIMVIHQAVPQRRISTQRVQPYMGHSPGQSVGIITVVVSGPVGACLQILGLHGNQVNPVGNRCQWQNQLG